MKTAIIVGAGHRALVYARYAQQHPDQFQIVGVADPSELRRQQVADRFGLRADNATNRPKRWPPCPAAPML